MRWGRSRRVTAWIAGSALVAGLMLVGLLRLASPSMLPSPGVGAPAPGFSLPALNGRMISLQRLRGQAIFINFWASWCPYCRAEAVTLQSLESRCRHLTVLEVAVDGGEARTSRFASQMGIGYPVLLDHDGLVANLYGATYLPTSVLVSPTGRIAWIDHGVFITGGEARSLVDRHLGGICLPDNTSHS